MRRACLVGTVVVLVSLGIFPTPAVAAGVSIPLPSHWWRAEGTAADSAGVDDGMLEGVRFGPGVLGRDRAFAFVGGPRRILFNARGGNFYRTDFTLAFWVKTTSSRKQALWEKRPVCDAASFWSFRMSAKGLIEPELMSDRLAHDYTPGFTSTSAVNDGAWHQVVLSRHATTAALYVDGRLEDSATTPRPTRVVNDTRMTAGVSVCDGIDGTSPFTGLLDELLIFPFALTPSQIQTPAA